MANKLNWDLEQQIIICERFCSYKGEELNLKLFLLKKAEKDGYIIEDEDLADSIDIASGADWSADQLMDYIIMYIEKNHKADTFKRYISNCFHAK